MLATLNIYVPLHCYCNLHIDPTILQISVKKQNATLPCHCHIPANNKYAPQIPHIGHMPKLLGVHLWGSYTNKWVTY